MISPKYHTNVTSMKEVEVVNRDFVNQNRWEMEEKDIRFEIKYGSQLIQWC